MKKIIFSITLLLVAALAISACSAATTVPPTATVGGSLPASTASTAGTETPAVPQTSPTTGATTAAPTSGATAAATTSATTAATSAATTAATSSGVTAVATTVTNTPGAAAATSAPVAGTTSTPFAGVPGQYVRLSILMQSNMVSGAQSGQITGVVIAQPDPVNGTATASPAVTQPVPYIRYVVVDMSASATPTPGTNEMLLPWQMFAFNPATTSADGKVSQTFTLKGSAAWRQNVPQVSLPNTSGILSQDWDTQLSQYWASQGFAIPVTGNNAQQETEVLLRQTVNGANIVDPKNQVLGQVTDFLIDPNTGQFVYAVFNGGQLFGNHYFVVPVRNLIFQLSSATSTGLGNVQLSVPSTVLNAAPFITNPGQIPVDPNLLQQLNNYWQSIQK